ncbi:MAG: peptidoglycan DD-metalloendopeptidase family protein [Flavobacteriaceae bacterium]|nr:peptidoglycan DD-metalloendopeptidase family protein [Flavobacteriaceae bacterium]
MIFNKKYSVVLKAFFIALLLLFSTATQAQTKKELELKRRQLKKEIRQINRLLFKTKTKEKSLLSQVTDLDRRIKTRAKLLSTINLETSLLTSEITDNELKIKQLEKSLQQLKADYAAMIVKSYKSKSKESRMLFVVSSSNFTQAYNRLKYMKQYTVYRRRQGEEISLQTQNLKQFNTALQFKKASKDTLLIETQKEQDSIKIEKVNQKKLIAKIKRREKKYLTEIRKKQKEDRNLNRKIKKLIRDAIAASNKTGSVFKLTAEAKLLAAEFTANKGKLPWPVAKGLVVLGYGTQRHPVVKTATIQSNGVRIATEKGAYARTVFNGKVLAIQLIPGGQKAVLIQHGNYISVYKNLDVVIVSKGQMLSTKQNIGTVHTDKSTGKTILAFVLFKEVKTVNPALWIYKM